MKDLFGDTSQNVIEESISETVNKGGDNDDDNRGIKEISQGQNPIEHTEEQEVDNNIQYAIKDGDLSPRQAQSL